MQNQVFETLRYKIQSIPNFKGVINNLPFFFFYKMKKEKEKVKLLREYFFK